MSRRRQYSAAELPRIVKAERTVVHYLHTTCEAVIHAEGCKHRSDETRPLRVTDLGADDWFYVAPCAMRR